MLLDSKPEAPKAMLFAHPVEHCHGRFHHCTRSPALVGQPTRKKAGELNSLPGPFPFLESKLLRRRRWRSACRRSAARTALWQRRKVRIVLRLLIVRQHRLDLRILVRPHRLHLRHHGRAVFARSHHVLHLLLIRREQRCDLRLLVVRQRYGLVNRRHSICPGSSSSRHHRRPAPSSAPCSARQLHNATTPMRAAYLRIIILFIGNSPVSMPALHSPADKSTATDGPPATRV